MVNALVPETVVCAPVSSLIHIRTWDDECVVFDVASSATHLIQQPAGFLLEWVMAEPVTIAHLADRLNSIAIVENQADTLQYVVNTVQSFIALGLLEAQELSV